MGFETYYSLRELASKLSVSVKFLRRRIAAGELRGVVNLGSDLRIPENAILGWLVRHQRGPASGPAVAEESSRGGIRARTVGELRRKAGANG